MINTEKAQIELNLICDNVIGLFKYYNKDDFELVVKDNGDSVDVISFTKYGIINEEFGLPLKFGEMELFPEGLNLNQMRNNPFEFYHFCKSFL